MERLQRKVVRFFKRAKLVCVYLHKEERDDIEGTCPEFIEGVDRAKIFAIAYTGISQRFH